MEDNNLLDKVVDILCESNGHAGGAMPICSLIEDVAVGYQQWDKSFSATVDFLDWIKANKKDNYEKSKFTYFINNIYQQKQ